MIKLQIPATSANLGAGFDAVIHFAACSLVGESVTDPLKYYNNRQKRKTKKQSVKIEHLRYQKEHGQYRLYVH